MPGHGMCVVRGEEDDVVGARGQGLEAHIHMASFSKSQSATSLELERSMIIKGPGPTTQVYGGPNDRGEPAISYKWTG